VCSSDLDRERHAVESEVQPEEAVSAPNDDESMRSLQVLSEADAAVTRAAAGSSPLAGDANEEADVPAEAVYARSASTPSTPGLGGADAQRDRRFQASQPTEAVPSGAISADLFYETSYDTVLQPMVEWVVQHEGPVLDAVLARRIARAHGFQRTGSRIQERVEQIARRLFDSTEEDGGTFYWPHGIETQAEFAFRWPSDGDSARGVEEICEPELIWLARWVLQQGHTGQEALIAIGRELGLQRLRETSRVRLELVISKVHQC
jgi:hypothetical protein